MSSLRFRFAEQYSKSVNSRAEKAEEGVCLLSNMNDSETSESEASNLFKVYLSCSNCRK